ncbi:MAG: transporter ATP-binding protein [Clostridiales bacterium]|nr:transporter ATP-binding protein [Clostridiales bacterium]
MLKIKNLVASYGHIEALHNVNMEVGDKEIVALIGSNGAGKTTMLNSISGHVKVSGEIEYNGVSINSKRPHNIASMGILQVPEGRHVFPGLTVEQNLTVGIVVHRGMKLTKGNISEDIEMIYETFPRLKERRKQLAWSLSGGEQQMLVIGRAMMGHPKLLMMDEPSMGLAPLVIEEVFEKIVEINKAGTPVLLVEQNASLALQVSNRAYIIERGNITLSGDSKDLIKDERVREAYLGKSKK